MFKAQASVRVLKFADAGREGNYRILFARRAEEDKGTGVRGEMSVGTKKGSDGQEYLDVQLRPGWPVKTIEMAVEAVTWRYRVTSPHFLRRMEGACKGYLKAQQVRLCVPKEETFGIYAPFAHIVPFDPTQFGLRAAQARTALQKAINQYVGTAKEFVKEARTKEVKEWASHRAAGNDPWWTALIEQAVAGDIGRMPAHPSCMAAPVWQQESNIFKAEKVAPNVVAALKRAGK